MNYYKELDAFRIKFNKEKLFMSLIKEMMKEDIDSEDEKWGIEKSVMFSFLYENGLSISSEKFCENDLWEDSDDDKVIIKYNDSFLELSRLCGQGTIDYIRINPKETDNFVLFGDVVIYHETGVKPLKKTIEEILLCAIETLKTAHMSESITLNKREISFNTIKKYLDDNLKK